MSRLKTAVYAGSILMCALLLGRATHAAEFGQDRGDTEVVDTQVTRTTDSKGLTTEKRVVTKVRSRTVVDFEEASIEGKVKKPNAAYLLHGADLEFKHLYRVKHGQKNRILGSYEYVR
ncbi:MAG TPA: hypothetical protein PLH57_09670 [Oligoflexia bacterium]|nr:hypothetical protein [Oligoflexia bacterium]